MCKRPHPLFGGGGLARLSVVIQSHQRGADGLIVETLKVLAKILAFLTLSIKVATLFA